jgi:hypothetical protein
MSNNSRDITSPDGLYKVEFDEREMRMSHWVCSPRIIDVNSNKVLLDLWNTQWDAEVSFEDSGEVLLSLRHYPGNISGFDVHINPPRDTYYFEDQPECIERLPDLRQRLDQRYLKRQQEVDALSPSAPIPLSTKIGRVWQHVQLLLMLILGLLFAIGGSWWLLSGEGGITALFIVLGALGSLVFVIGDIKEMVRRKR